MQRMYRVLLSVPLAAWLAACALDGYGIPHRGLVILGMLYILIGILGLLVRLAIRWERSSLRNLVPLLLCVGVLIMGVLLERWLPYVRFALHRRHYDAVATGIYNGRHPERLLPEDSNLGFWVSAIRSGDVALPRRTAVQSEPIKAVDFYVFRGSFASGRGFMRVFDDEITRLCRDGRTIKLWRSCTLIGDGWYWVSY
jgi:hypothetical protein